MNTDAKKPSPFLIYFMWTVILLGYLLTYFHPLSTGILQPYIMEEFSVSAIEATSIASMYFYCYLFMQIPTGLLVDKFGLRKVSSIGLLCAGIGTLCFAMASNVPMLYIGKALIGLGVAPLFVCIIKFQIAWIKPSLMTTMTGLACFLATLGGMLAQSPLAWIIEQIGWRTTFYAITVFTFSIMILSFLLIKDKPSIDEDSSQSASQEFSVWKALFSIIIDWRTWPVFILYATFYGSYIVVMGYSGTSWLSETFSLSTLGASSYIIIGVFGSAVGSIVVGAWSDKIRSRKKPMIVIGIIYLITWAVLAFGTKALSLSLVPAVLFSIGFCSCAFVVCWACVQEINPKEYGGIAVSVVNMGGFVGPIVLPYLFVLAQNSYAEPSSLDAFSSAFQAIFWAVVFGFVVGLFTKEPFKN